MSVSGICSGINQAFKTLPAGSTFAVAGLLTAAVSRYYQNNLGYVLSGLLFAASAAAYFSKKQIAAPAVVKLPEPAPRPLIREEKREQSLSQTVNFDDTTEQELKSLSTRKDITEINFMSMDFARMDQLKISAGLIQLIPRHIQKLNLSLFQPVQSMFSMVTALPLNLQKLTVKANKKPPGLNSLYPIYTRLARACPNLKELEIIQIDDGEADLHGMSDLLSLETLVLNGGLVTSKDHANKLPPKLKKLYMSSKVDSRKQEQSIQLAIKILKSTLPGLKVYDLEGRIWQATDYEEDLCY